jgi:hypothetical protein
MKPCFKAEVVTTCYLAWLGSVASQGMLPMRTEKRRNKNKQGTPKKLGESDLKWYFFL